MLNELGGSGQQSAPPPMMSMPPMMQSQQMSMPPMMQSQQMSMDNLVEPLMMQDMSSMAGPSHFASVPIQQSFHGLDDMQQVVENKYVSALLSWNNDLKIALFAVGIFIIVTMIPFEKYIYQYVSLDKIPHSATVIKAVLGGILLLVLMKVVQ